MTPNTTKAHATVRTLMRIFMQDIEICREESGIKIHRYIYIYIYHERVKIMQTSWSLSSSTIGKLSVISITTGLTNMVM